MRTILAVLWLLFPAVALAEPRHVCVYDPAGKTGDYYRMMEEWALAASGWGAEIVLKPYTDEETAAKDYEAGKCDGVVATGVRLQRFNRFPSTIEAIGALPSYDHLKALVSTLASSPNAAGKMKSGDHETVGVVPVGAVYLFVRDRNVDSVAELAGKRIATMDYDKAAPTMVERVGAIMVAADLGSIGPKFNNGDVDACYVSAPAYRPFELWRGLDARGGGVLKAPLAQATLQVMVRAPKFPAEFGAKSRTHFAGKFDPALEIVKKSEAEIASRYWVTVPPDTLEAWDEMFQGVRLKLKESGGYDAAMLSAMRKIRCSKDSARAECAEQKE
jgi:hypothetical protein